MRPWILILLAPLALATACDKPSADECKQAYANIQKVKGKGIQTPGAEVEANKFERQCRAEMSAKAVRCVSSAATEAEMDACYTK